MHHPLEDLKPSLGLFSSFISLNRQLNWPTGEKPPELKVAKGSPKKLDDVLHDIIVLKRAVHNPDPKMTLLTDLNFLPRYQQR